MASFTIPDVYVDQFSANVYQLSRQRMSRLRRTVTRMEELTGESKRLDRSDVVDDTPNEVTERYGQMPLNLINYDSRWLFPKNYDFATLVDTFDKAKLLLDPQSTSTREHAGTMGRKMDDTIIAALGGNAYSGTSGSTAVPLPAAQEIATGSVGLTTSKLITAKEILSESDVDPDQPYYLIYNPRQLSDMLEDPKIQSSDFNMVKALVEGTISRWMGFEWILSNRLTLTSTTRFLYAYTASALVWGDHIPVQSRTDLRPDLRGVPYQAYTWGGWDVTRMEDTQVVEIACTEN